MKIGNSKLSDIVYGKLVGNIRTRSLFSAGYLLTKDNYICLVLDKNNILNLIGGMTSLDDIKNNNYNPESCLIREFEEEIGVNIDDGKFNYVLKYIKYPNINEAQISHYPIGTI